MRHTRTLLLTLLLWPALVFAQALSLDTDRPRADYAAGQNANFLLKGPAGEYTYRIRYSLNTDVIAEGKVQHNGGTSKISYKLDSPGFIVAQVAGPGGGAQAAATFSKEDIPMYSEEPADFDAFWSAQKAKLAAVPLDVESFVIGSNEYTTSYQWSAAQVDGRRVYGYIVIPKGGGPYPAVLQLPPFGSGANIAEPDPTLAAQDAGVISVSITIHNAPPNQADPRAYQPDNPTNRDEFYYRYAVLAAIRAIDYIATRPEWNRRDLAVWGDSQGGGLAIMTAGIDKRPNLLIQSVAALSQLNGSLRGRPEGFPYYVNTAEALNSDRPSVVQRVRDNVRYYDAGFAARRFTGPSLHYNNYLDAVTPPETSYAAHNQMGGSTVMLHTLNQGHGNPPQVYNGEMLEFIRLHFPAARNAPNPYASTKVGHAIDAGAFISVDAGQAYTLRGRYSYNGSTDGSWPVVWDVVSGPGQVNFSNPGSVTSGVSFSTPGSYRLRLRVTDPLPNNPNQFYVLTDEVNVQVGGQATTSSSDELRESIGLSTLQVGPNPATHVLRVSGAFTESFDYSLELRDVTGRMVRSSTATGRQLDAEWSVAELARGMYTVVITTARGAVAEQIVLQ